MTAPQKKYFKARGNKNSRRRVTKLGIGDIDAELGWNPATSSDGGGALNRRSECRSAIYDCADMKQIDRPDPPSHFPHTPTTNFDHGFNIPAKEGAQRCFSDVRCIHPRSKPCESYLWDSTSSSRLGTAGILLTMIQVPFPYSAKMSFYSRLSRTRWAMIRTTSTLAGLVAMYARCFTGD